MELTVQESLSKLIELAKTVRMDNAQRIEQRNSFVYGNTKIENAEITEELVAEIGATMPLRD